MCTFIDSPLGAALELSAGQFPGWDGFLGTRASLAMDVVVVVMAAALPCLAWSIQQVRCRRYALHRRLQLALTFVLLLAVTAFEVDVRVNGWRQRAFGDVDASGGDSSDGVVMAALAVHLVFAISTAVLWPTVVVLALRRFPKSPQPGEHSATHRRWARIAVCDLTATAVTGWIFYWLAFVR